MLSVIRNYTNALYNFNTHIIIKQCPVNNSFLIITKSF